MADRQTVSVAICTYNCEKYLLDQLKSISSQTVLPDEIIICDDCSTDNTIKIIEKFKRIVTNIDITVHINEHQLGFRKNYEQCFGLCNGDIVFYCDQDDVWLDNKIERIISEFTVDTVFVFSDAYVTDEKLNIISDSEWNIEWDKLCTCTQDYFDYVQTRNFPLGHVQAFRKKLIQSIIPFMSDPDGWIAQCAPAFGNVKAIPEKLVYYRRHNNTASNAFIGNRTKKTEMLKKLFITSFQEHFVWPAAETKVYEKLLEYVESNNYIQSSKLVEHIGYLNYINQCENRNFIFRIKTINKLYKTGVYPKYRGNKKALIYDRLFMFINSLTKNHS